MGGRQLDDARVQDVTQGDPSALPCALPVHGEGYEHRYGSGLRWSVCFVPYRSPVWVTQRAPHARYRALSARRRVFVDVRMMANCVASLAVVWTERLVPSPRGRGWGEGSCAWRVQDTSCNVISYAGGRHS